LREPEFGAEMKICDDVSDFQPTREEVEKAFEMFGKELRQQQKMEEEK